ncbi:PD-(D/E)XK nuclease family protein [Aurantibacter crassamenti]|uniref:PD-(D/E)XK nuclease family protein n=1 Tax=Aurantibacter crassamenti TaxID=1837375 RepID=UPI0019398FB8|nr:PD-(D/E)XK nuclease family protein [Aurantibacter crassamenti]MBM1104997.1 PD-(D/E)XK nuclease family protein [Aurantibacter crassamenti]
MQSFLEEVVQQICQEYDKLENIIFILPSKRSGTFLRKALAQTANKTLFAPQILSIEGFVESISGLTTATHTQQLFELYKVYRTIATDEQSDFYSFSKWASTLLQDFNEIDRYLVEATELFSNLTDIQEITHWSPESEKTKMMEDYLQFWNQLEPLYHAFNESLINQNLGHQGLIYRRAFENLEAYLNNTNDKIHVFIGFNALNKSETLIIQKIIADNKNKIFWDIDQYFLNDQTHDASFFLRDYLKNWEYFENSKMIGVSNHYLSPKNIEIIGLPKNVSQSKYVGSLLNKIENNESDSLKNTAVILGDETILNPILNSIPKQIDHINITMGYQLGNTPLASLFEQLINLYINKETRGWYHRTILDLLSHPYLQILLSDENNNFAQNISKTIASQNWSFIQSNRLIKICTEQEQNLSLLFTDEIPTTEIFISNCLKVIDIIRLKLEKSTNNLELEYLYRFYKLFNQISELVQQYPFVNDLKSLHSLYKELLSSETLDFQGEPLEGLQIMGMLESRNLDFETVILTSVNEGILPSGKSNNSFIPIDLKHSFGLPTYKEKDAVYTYHFYRILQRAKNVYLLYNTDSDLLEGGEKSRLLMQLLTDNNKIGDIKETVISPSISPIKKELVTIPKDSSLIELIKEHATSGFSPTSLSNYIRNPIDFYKRNLLKIDDLTEVEETVAANTFGTIVHDTLEVIYTPFIGKELEVAQLERLKTKIPNLVKIQFEKTYAGGDFSTGKNLIAFNVIVKYIENFIDIEISEVEQHRIKIVGLEKQFRITLNFPELDYPVFLKGKLDRIDEIDGQIRIIDFKTGKVEPKNVEIVDWLEVISEYEYSKAFQLLCYALMYNEQQHIESIESGIISFKNLPAGVLKFAFKDKRARGAKKLTHITQETLVDFKEQLKKLILEICNASIPLTEKEI